MNNLQDHFYKKKEADNFYDRWVVNNKKEYLSICAKNLREEKSNILNCLRSNIKLKKKKCIRNWMLCR